MVLRWPDSLIRSGGELPFFDRSGLTRYPIDGSKLTEARFVIQTYTHRDHFVRRIHIAGMQLTNFIGAAGAAQAPAIGPVVRRGDL